MQKEIFEQPEVFFRTFTAVDETDLGALSEAKSIRVVACGTSYHAGLIFRYLMAEYSEIPVTVEIGSECRLIRPLNHELVIGITQSGETADTIAALQSAIAHNCPTLAITNVLGSSVTRVADNTIFTHAGPEISVAATKSFLAQVAVFLKMTSWFCNGAFPINPVVCKQVIDNILLSELEDAVAWCLEAKSMFFIGRGVYYPVALEGALKMKEITYIHAEGYAAGELKHGPFALLSEDTPVVAICLPGDDYDLMFANIKEIKARSAPVIVICVENDLDLKDLADVMIPIPQGTNAEHLLSSLVLLQMLAYETAKILGRDVDKPRNLAKSVTVI
jgi:glucosamine--fructose-6-phosphate aminotransferase (isomerizing)